jgi:hypothetical protein
MGEMKHTPGHGWTPEEMEFWLKKGYQFTDKQKVLVEKLQKERDEYD